jgi:hypothetical protein
LTTTDAFKLAVTGKYIQFFDPQLEQMRTPELETARVRLASQLPQSTMRLSSDLWNPELANRPAFGRFRLGSKLTSLPTPDLIQATTHKPVNRRCSKARLKPRKEYLFSSSAMPYRQGLPTDPRKNQLQEVKVKWRRNNTIYC